MTLRLKVVADAKSLMSNLKDSTTKAENLISLGKELQKEIDDIITYKENDNDVKDSPPSGSQPENAQIIALERENKELRCAIIEQQNGLELIMSKYRQHITKLVNDTKVDYPKMNDGYCYEKMLQQTLKIQEMAKVMEEAGRLDLESLSKNDERLQELLTENEGLRELMTISSDNGSLDMLAEDSEDLSLRTNSVKTMIRRKVSNNKNDN